MCFNCFKMLLDGRCELLCFLPRLASHLGLNPGKKFLEWYGRCLAVKTQDPDITFLQVTILKS